MTKTGSKFRTVYAFGKRKRKRRDGKQSSDVLPTDPLTEQLDLPPSTSSATQFETVTVASARKIHFFKGKKRQESSDSDSEPGPSQKAMRLEEEEEDVEENVASADLNFIVDLSCLQSLVTMSGVLCPQCKMPSLRVIKGGPDFRKESACLLELKCLDCGKLATEMTSKKTGIIHTGFDINRRILAASTATGTGFRQMKRIPQPMSEKNWYVLKQRVHTGAKRAADKHLQEAAEQVRTSYIDMNLAAPDADGIFDISISIDGSWQKRGRTSRNGIVTVIDIMTGLVVDFVALSNYCHVCETGPKPEDADYIDWREKHKTQCQKNVDCSSGAMEMEGALILFRRSVQLHGFRYTEMLGDGDAKTYARLLEADPYDGRPIDKLECVNHVTKRMGTALRNLVQKKKAQGETIGGRGKLTDVRIKELTNYYGRAIKDNSGDCDAMQNAVWATFYHTMSTDESHNHERCPKGSFSWCFYQRAIADNVPPRPHRRCLPASIAQDLKPVYQRLGDPQLLRRCLAGKTQNSNESFHSVLWGICPKERWSNHRTVDTALAIAVQRFNKGSTAMLDVMFELELMTGPSLEEYSLQEDTTRVAKAKKSASSKEKERGNESTLPCVKNSNKDVNVKERCMGLDNSKIHVLFNLGQRSVCKNNVKVLK